MNQSNIIGQYIIFLVYSDIKLSAISDLVQTCYLIGCGGYDTDWKSESYSKSSCKDESPPWHLDLIDHKNAQYKSEYQGHHKHHVEPPARYVLVLPHQSCVNILFSSAI